MIKFILGYVVPLYVLCPLIVGLRGYRSFDAPAKTIVWYLVLSAITNLVGVSMALNHHNNMPVFHVFTLLEFLLLTLFFRQLTINANKRLFFDGVMIAFSIFAIINSIYIEPIHTYNSYSRSIESLLLIAFSLISFYAMLGQNNKAAEATKNLIWINIGFICYFSGSLFLFISQKYIIKDPVAGKITWIIHAIFVAAFLYTMITVYLIKSKNPK